MNLSLAATVELKTDNSLLHEVTVLELNFLHLSNTGGCVSSLNRAPFLHDCDFLTDSRLYVLSL